MLAKVWVEPLDRRRRLAELGLEEEWLREPAKRGLFAWARCTRHHPLPFPGYSQWAETVAGLRDTTVPHGWASEDRAGLPLTVERNLKVAMTAWTGDEGTGNEHQPVFSKSARGPKTVEFVERNQILQMALDLTLPEASEVPNIAASLPDETTWILLFHRDRLRRELRIELSRPVKLGMDKRATEWGERIILDSVQFDDDSILLPDPRIPDEPDVDFEIFKRGA